ncbi:MAG: hypothetical protein IPM79_16780 [Polyangiaceae bacterium]|nr:hypothetical protein [Polyangiaceae bacterium]
MLKTGTMPEEGRGLIERLDKATAAMVALEDEVETLKHRLDNGDIAAIHLGVRRIVEALLRHANRAEGIELPKNGTLQSLRDTLRSKTKDRLSAAFWRYLDVVQDAVNPNTHYQEDDVYRASGLRRGNPWDEILNVVRSLVCLTEEFVHHWAPPPPVATPDERAGAARPTGKAAATNDDGGSPSPDVEEDDDDEPTARPRAKPSRQETDAVSRLTVSDARNDPEVRAWLASASGMHARGVSRRLNATHGSTKLTKLFPAAFEIEELPDDNDEYSTSFDYEEIGNLTIKEAREFELAEDIATLIGRSPATVRKKLKELHGGGVVRRQFNWYYSEDIGELTVSTALRYNVAPVLARAFREPPASIRQALRSTPGQTKLKTLFPRLLGAEG